MTKSTVSAVAVSSISAEESINNSLFIFGAIWALALGYMTPAAIGLMLIFGK